MKPTNNMLAKNVFHQHNNKDHKFPTLDPGRGDGKTVNTSQPLMIVDPYMPKSNVVVRDHRSGAPQGGVSVTTNPNSIRNTGIPTLSGPGPLDMLGNGLSAAGSALGDLFSTEVGDASPNRDHRTPVNRKKDK